MLLVPQLPDAVEPGAVGLGKLELLDADVAGHDLLDRREPVAAMGEQLEIGLAVRSFADAPCVALGSPFERGQHHRQDHDVGPDVRVGPGREVLRRGLVDAQQLCGQSHAGRAVQLGQVVKVACDEDIDPRRGSGQQGAPNPVPARAGDGGGAPVQLTQHHPIPLGVGGRLGFQFVRSAAGEGGAPRDLVECQRPGPVEGKVRRIDVQLG
ncbi:hypothetical protein D522_18894 [Mycobacterium avium subsp. paratuberculosis S5]|nr:hypothetical protein D522_18894 [Mycobacterium avium subsp. paratuberculosis S5]